MSDKRFRRLGWAVAALFGLVAIMLALNDVDEGPHPHIATSNEPPLEPLMPRQDPGEEYVTSDACRECHAEAYDTWHDSYHRTMTQIASPETVAAPFDDVELENRGRRYHLTRRGDEFRVLMPDPDWEGDLRHEGVDLSEVSDAPMVERAVVMTTGSHHYQGYWVPSRYGSQLWQLPFVYHFEMQRWVPREDVFLAPPSDYRQLVIWNANCIQCHVVAGKPGLGPQKNALYSSFVEAGIACESCHGPGAAHVKKHRRSGIPAELTGRQDPTIVNPARLSAERSSMVCGQCHSFFYTKHYDEWWQDGFTTTYRPGEDLSESRFLPQHGDKMPEEYPAAVEWAKQIPGGIDAKFWPDGAVRLGGREYVGIADSPCHLHGDEAKQISCLSCHSLHEYVEPNDLMGADRLANKACTQCHDDPQYVDDVESHTRHPPGTAGSLCYNCHMPRTSYALLKALRAHRIDSPDAVSSSQTGRPNACNLCHLDRTLAWTADRLTEWYGHPDGEFSEDERTVAASLLWLLKGDAAQRVVTAWHLGWQSAQEASGRQWTVPVLAELLNDPYAAVRFVAYRSLRTLPGMSDFRYDYLSNEYARQDATRRALQLWSASEAAAEREGRDPTTVLLTPEGTIDRRELQRLLLQRDDRPLVLSE